MKSYTNSPIGPLWALLGPMETPIETPMFSDTDRYRPIPTDTGSGPLGPLGSGPWDPLGRPGWPIGPIGPKGPNYIYIYIYI